MSRLMRLLLPIVLIGTGCTPASDAPDAMAQKVQPGPAVTISVNGGRSSGVTGDETAATCAAFRLTEAQVRMFFARAKPVNDRAYNHDLDMSPCFAAGTLRSSGDADGEWTIDQAGRGQIVEATGKRRYLFCADCPVPPFHEPAPDDAEAEAAGG